MSSRVFGYFNQSSYNAAANTGFFAPNYNPMAFGSRPGDYPYETGAGVGDFSPNPVNGGVMGLDSGQTSQLTDALLALTGAIQRGFRVGITQMNPTTGQTAAQTVNANNNYDSSQVSRGGGSQPNRGF